MSDEKIEDVAIVGLGPAGITAGIYLKRFGFDPIAFEKKKVGGKLFLTHEIENYPGFVGDGQELAARLADQFAANNIRTKTTTVSTITKDDNIFKVQSEDGVFYFRSVIVATGVREKEFKIPGSESFDARGISRCAVCDGPLYRKKSVAVYGSGKTAVEEADYLASIVSHVTFLQDAETLRADPALVKSFSARPNVTLLKPCTIVRAEGTRSLEKLVVLTPPAVQEQELEVSALFLYVGSTASTSFLPFPEIFSPTGFIRAEESGKTAIAGLYAAGDVRVTNLRQIVTAAGDGARAALAVKDYLKALSDGSR